MRKFFWTAFIVAAVLVLASAAVLESAHARVVRSQRVSAVTLYGAVNDKSASHVVAAIHAANAVRTNDPIVLFINSPGGDVFAGGRIVDAITASRRPVYTVNVSLAASMAAIIFSYGQNRYCLPHALVMFHDASMAWEGDVDKLTSRLSIFGALMHSYNVHLAKLLGISVEQIDERERVEWWVSPAECVKSHLCMAVISIGDYPA